MVSEIKIRLLWWLSAPSAIIYTNGWMENVLQVSVGHQWHAAFFSFGFTIYKGRIWWNAALSSCHRESVYWYRDSCPAPGGRTKALLSPAASIHSVRWARSSYCGTNVGPPGRNANWSRTKWQVSRRKNKGGNLHPPSQHSCAQWASFNIRA